MTGPAGETGAPKIFSYEYYERLYNMEQLHWWQVGMRALAGRLLGPHLPQGEGLRILDAGCGTGSMLSWLTRYASPERVAGIDLSRYALQFCGQRHHRRLAEASVTSLPFPERMFDLVVFLDTLQHLPRDGSDGQALRECRRVLRPGGLLLLRTNVRLAPAAGQVSDGHAADYHQYTREELVADLEAEGLAVRRITYGNMLPALAQTWVRRLRRPHHHTHGAAHHDRGLGLRIPPLGLNAVLKVVMAAEAAYVGRRRALPYGHSLLCVAQRGSDGE